MSERAAQSQTVDPQVPGQQAEGEEESEAPSGMPPWLEVAFPWMVSCMLHLGIFLVAAFIWYAGMRAMDADKDKELIIIPNADPSMLDGDKPGGVPHPGTGGDPTRDAEQDKIKEVLKTDGWAQKESDNNVASMLEGASAENEADLIGLGTGGSIGKGTGGSGRGEGGPLAPYGTPGGGTGAGPKSNFYGSGGNATRIVYIIDHSGSLLDNFDFLRQEVTRSVGNLVPVQFFNVVMVSEEAHTVLIPGQLARASAESKKEFISKIAEYRAQGMNDDLLEPFKQAFEEAFKTKPQLVYFLTDGHFDPKLMDVVDKLNKDHKVKVNTLAFVNKEPSYEDQLKEMAKKNNGAYKFVSERDLGK